MSLEGCGVVSPLVSPLLAPRKMPCSCHPTEHVMKRSLLALIAFFLTATAVAAQDVGSVLRPGEGVPEFEFVDLTGPNRGKQLSQVERFGAAPVVMAVVNESPYFARDLVAGMQKLAETYKAEKLNAFVAFIAGPEVREPLWQVAREGGATIPVGYVADRKQLAAYRINAAARNTVLVYRNRKVHAAFTDVDGKGLLDVLKATKQMLDARAGAE
jgi:hypothetical protein